MINFNSKRLWPNNLAWPAQSRRKLERRGGTIMITIHIALIIHDCFIIISTKIPYFTYLSLAEYPNTDNIVILRNIINKKLF